MGTSTKAIISLVAALSLPVGAGAQSLADAARKAEEERAKATQAAPAKLFTNDDLVELAPSRAAAPVATTAAPEINISNKTTARTPDEVKPTGAVRVSRTYTANGDALQTTLTLVLRDRQGKELPINLLFRGVHEDRSRSNVPSELTLVFGMSPTFGGMLDLKPPHAVLVIDEGRPSAYVATFATIGPLGGGMSFVALEPFDLAFLARLGEATTLRGRLFNIEFALTPEQIRSISEFSQQARQRPKRPA